MAYVSLQNTSVVFEEDLWKPQSLTFGTVFPLLTPSMTETIDETDRY